MIEFLALLDPDTRSDHLAWAARLADLAEPIDRSELEIVRHACQDRLTWLQAAVVQDEPLPRAERPAP